MGDNGKHVETTRDKDRQEGRQGETRLREGGHTIQHRHTCGDNGRQFGNKTSGRRTHHPTQVHTCGETMGENGEQWGTRGDKTLKRRAHHPTQTHIVGRQAETRPREGRHTIQHRHMWGDSGRQWQTRERPEKADIPSQAHMWRDNRRQKGKTTRREGRPTIQHRQMCGETMRDNALNGTEWGEKGRRDLGKADTPSNTGTHVGRQWETRRQEGGRTIQHRHTCGKTMGNIRRQGRDKTSRLQMHHPTQAHMWGRDNGGKVETRYRDGGHANQQKGNTKGDIGWETKGDKTKANTLRMR